MKLFSLSEKKTRVFHQAVLELASEHPCLISRAQKELLEFCSLMPEQKVLWDRWQDLLMLPYEKIAKQVLADTPDGGLLRAESPFHNALSKVERTAIWQRIGLLQFLEHYFVAVADLELEISEQSAITGISVEELQAWQTRAPKEMRKESVECLKLIVALQKSLIKIAPDREVRRHWLRHESQTLSAIPLSLLMGGKTLFVMEYIVGATQLTLNNYDMPRMGLT
jgi:hypothetical protein